MELTDLKIIVTGAARGMGAYFARQLVAAGARVAAGDVSVEGLECLAADTAALPGSLHSRSLDVAGEEETAAFVDWAGTAMGGLNGLINNAGIIRDGLLATMDAQQWQDVIDTNLGSVYRFSHAVTRPMMSQRSGRIINISSVVGSTGNPTQSVYGMTKAALNNLTKTAAMELAQHNILVNAVAPGFIDTAMTEELPEEVRADILARVPLGRLGRPEEVADMVRWLATGATYCTGTVFHVNGGMYGG